MAKELRKGAAPGPAQVTQPIALSGCKEQVDPVFANNREVVKVLFEIPGGNFEMNFEMMERGLRAPFAWPAI